jgi:6-phosphogluconolactonase
MAEVITLPDPAALAQAAAEHFVAQANAAIMANGRFTVALSGGSTPKTMHTILATQFASALDWSHVFVFWGDERCVPPNSPDSNYGMALDTLLKHVPIPAENIHRMRGEVDPSVAAEKYNDLLVQFFGGAPHLDLVFLGMGDDGHTASLFPHTTALYEPSDHYCVANLVEKLNTWRITLTTGSINAAHTVIFLVAGAAKAARLKEVLYGERRPDDLPSQRIQPTSGHLLWMIDQAASG